MLQEAIERMEKRAMESLDMAIQEMAVWAIHDPYHKWHPEDSHVWIGLLTEAKNTDEDLYTRLVFMRAGGTVLTKNSKFGYVLDPIISADGWASQEEYDKEKKCLVPHLEKLIPMLRRIKK